jgi:hypothetical protein
MKKTDHIYYWGTKKNKMSSFCGCLAKVKEFIGFNDQLIDASGLRKHTNPLAKKKDKTGWNLK